MTYGVVLFTLVVQGLPIGGIVRRLGLLEPRIVPGRHAEGCSTGPMSSSSS